MILMEFVLLFVVVFRKLIVFECLVWLVVIGMEVVVNYIELLDVCVNYMGICM